MVPRSDPEGDPDGAIAPSGRAKFGTVAPKERTRCGKDAGELLRGTAQVLLRTA